MYDREGRTVVAKRPVWHPDVYHVAINSVAPTPEGTLLVSAEVWETSGARSVSMIAEVIGNGTLRWVSRTPALADHLCITPTSAIWAMGGPGLERFDKTAAFDLLTRYRRDGRLESTSLPYRASPRLHYADMRLNSYLVTSAKGTLGFYNGAAGEWTGFDSSGKLVSQQKIPLPLAASENAPYRIFNIVMTSSGGVHAWLYAPSGNVEDRGIFLLDRQKGHWVRARRSLPQGYAGIYGVDGDLLITRFGVNTYAWFEPEQ